MPKKVTFDVTANTKGAQKGLSDLSKSSQLLQGVLGKLGVVGQGISSVLDKFTGKSLDMTAVMGVGVAAVGAAVAIGEKAISMYVELGDKIRKYSVLTSQSAEVSSRQIQAFEELGVGADVAGAGMFKLAKAIELTPKKLTELGIVIAKNVDGTTDLNGTLLNVMNAYQLTGDAAKRAAIIFAAFGKAGAAMIPILETNVAQLKQLESQVASVYTQKDLDAIRQYTIQQKELKQQSDDLGVSLGRVLLPVQLDLIESLNQEIYVQGKLEEARNKSGVSAAQMAHSGGTATTALQKNYQAAQDARAEIDRLTQAQLDAAAAAKAEADAEDTLYNAIHKNLDSHFAYRQALLDLKKAQKDATDAKGKDAEANLRLEEAMFNVSDAAVKQAEDQAALSGQTLTTGQSADIQIASLKNLSAHLDKKSQLYKDIQAYIALLRGIPASVITNITANVPGSSHQKPTARAGGGPVSPGSAYTVGEHGPETLVMGDQGGGIIPNGGGQHIYIDLRGAYIDPTGPQVDKLTTAIAQRLRFTTGI